MYLEKKQCILLITTTLFMSIHFEVLCILQKCIPISNCSCHWDTATCSLRCIGYIDTQYEYNPPSYSLKKPVRRFRPYPKKCPTQSVPQDLLGHHWGTCVTGLLSFSCNFMGKNTLIHHCISCLEIENSYLYTFSK